MNKKSDPVHANVVIFFNLTLIHLTSPVSFFLVLGLAGLAEECWSQASGGRMASCWQSALVVRWFLLMLVWCWAPLGALSSLLASAERLEPFSFSSLPGKASVAQLDWLLSDKGPFHRCPEYTEFKERFQQGFSTRYKIYRYGLPCRKLHNVRNKIQAAISVL